MGCNYKNHDNTTGRKWREDENKKGSRHVLSPRYVSFFFNLYYFTKGYLQYDNNMSASTTNNTTFFPSPATTSIAPQQNQNQPFLCQWPQDSRCIYISGIFYIFFYILLMIYYIDYYDTTMMIGQ